MDNSEGKNELVEYPGNMNLIIEKAYRNQDKEVRFMDDGGTEYTINFNNMEEYPTVDKSDVITVTRRDKIKGSYDRLCFYCFLCFKIVIRIAKKQNKIVEPFLAGHKFVGFEPTG